MPASPRTAATHAAFGRLASALAAVSSCERALARVLWFSLIFLAASWPEFAGPARVSGADRNTAVPAGARVLAPETERLLKPGDHFVECANCPELVVIPEGEFLLGSARGEGDADEEGPGGKPLQVRVAHRYALGRFAVTNAEYQDCVAQGGCPPPAWQDPASPYNATTGSEDHFKRLGPALTAERHPIVGVSWGDARAYVRWLNARLGLAPERGYRLPSEVEWERAARAGREGLKYTWGNEFEPSAANAAGETGADRWPFTSPVGSFPPNAYGLYDMHGNVWQWVEDCYHLSYRDMPEASRTAGVAWTRACDERERRVLRGGSWIDDPRTLRAADRGGSPPEMRYAYVGLRVARTLLP
jgi:formylglycine-generating enzyme required for sulfatase activity